LIPDDASETKAAKIALLCRSAGLFRLADLEPGSDPHLDRPDGLDRVRFVGTLARSIALDPREAESHAARVPRARLRAIERDLDEQLWPDVHRDRSGRFPAEQASIGCSCSSATSRGSLSERRFFTQ